MRPNLLVGKSGMNMMAGNMHIARIAALSDLWFALCASGTAFVCTTVGLWHIVARRVACGACMYDVSRIKMNHPVFLEKLFRYSIFDE